MSIVNITEDWSKQTMVAGSNGRTTSRHFIVQTSDARSDTPLKVQEKIQGYGTSTCQFPKEGDVHPDDPFMPYRRCVLKRLAPCFYEAVALYENKTFTFEQNPLKEEPIVEMEWVSATEPIDMDVWGKPIRNVNGEPFYPYPTIDVFDIQLSISRNERANASYFSSLTYNFQNKVNSDIFLDFPPNTVRFIDLSYNSVVWNTFNFVNVKYTFLIRQAIDPWNGKLLGWTKRIFNCGYNELGYDALPKPILIGTSPTTIPFPLDPDGMRLDDSSIAAGGGFWKYVNIYPSHHFGWLKIKRPLWW